ncbi:pentatricopeptide repeat-containing protein At4g18840-like [Selaginella moellendorffii]|uniref:pentatricopeptide repeat-containing protein At4g18840-like n=1 Tax=Selaginella moellendorffii TaxID=88036 RepID=UPI000D1CF0CD|nr:pentatricopeptide repeat-containing protein At4g18840-like [Selaginella moellendorffii]|eukprot:XP_024536932.1 pentatricopeptide repeat-containing protein At4g18840-like [Selaginella moellendorffii]
MLGRWRHAAARRRILHTSAAARYFLSTAISDQSSLEELEALISKLERGEANATLEEYAVLLKHCANAKSLLLGCRVHENLASNGHIPGRYLRNLIIEMYGKCGSPGKALAVFQTILNPNVFSYTMLLLAYGQNRMEKEALEAFKLMDLDGVFPSEVTFMNALAVCSRLGNLRDARALHCCLVGSGMEESVVLQTAVCSMYTGCSRLDLAKQVFNQMVERSVVTWNAMLTAYARNGLGREAMELFWRMEQDGSKADHVTFLCLIEISEVLGDLEQTCILSFYGKHGNIRDARSLFEALETRNSVCWNAIIGIYAQHGFGEEAMALYQRMKAEKVVKPDEVTFINVLNACANLGELRIGKMVHEDISYHGLDGDIILLNALLNMYGRCGSLKLAREVFDSMSPRIGSSWTVMMTQYAEHGQGLVALDLFRDMHIEGLKMDDITFVIILSVCSHLGLLREGRDLFVSLQQDFGIHYLSEHYGCVVDLLARAGMLDVAEEFLERLPAMQFSPVHWTSLLTSCRAHGDVERGTRAAMLLFELDPQDSGTYAILEQLYTNAGRWDDLAELAKIMRARGIRLRAPPVEEDLFG